MQNAQRILKAGLTAREPGGRIQGDPGCSLPALGPRQPEGRWTDFLPRLTHLLFLIHYFPSSAIELDTCV